MGLNVSELVALLCFCAVGIQYSHQMIAEMRSIMDNCRREGGYCINVIPPPRIPRRRQQRRMGTRTRKGNRRAGRTGAPKPDPAALGQQHNRLPASAGGGSAAGGAAGGVAGGITGQPAYVPRQGGATPTQAPPSNNPFSFFDNLFGPNSDPMSGLFGMTMLTRKRRQAAEPMEAAEIPRIRRGESMYNFLNAHCRKSEFDFGCRRTGGMCCLPHL